LPLSLAKVPRFRLLVPLLAALAGMSVWAQPNALPRAVPVEPIPAIPEAFQFHSVVVLSDAHGNEQAHTFLRSLIDDPRFAATVNDIVVEFGNGRYQELMDRFVRGEEVPEASLRLVWQNTTKWRTLKAEEQLDAVLYLGPRSAMARDPYLLPFAPIPST
jgi:hypothetical protein